MSQRYPVRSSRRRPVWYDVDARIFPSRFIGCISLSIPGCQAYSPDPKWTRLSQDFVGEGSDLRRLASAAELSESGAGHDALLVPMTAAGPADWVLALIGSVPADAEVVLRLIARIAGMQYAAFAERRAQAARRQFDGQLADTTKVPELVAIRVVHLLSELLQASSGSLTLTRLGMTRRIAAVGSTSGEALTSVPPGRISIAGSHRVHARARR